MKAVRISRNDPGREVLARVLRHLVLFILALLITIPAVSCSKTGTDSAQPADSASTANSGETNAGEVAATVNGKDIPMSEVETAVRNTAMRMGAGNMPVATLMDQLAPRVLDQLISGELLYQEALDKGFKADKAKVEESFNELAEQFPTREEFNAEMESRDFTEETLRANMSKQITIQTYLDETIVQGIEIDDTRVREYYDENPDSFREEEQIRASHILINAAENATEDEKQKALDRAREVAGLARAKDADFAELAKEYSEGPSGPSGGDLGLFGRGKMVKPFEEAAFSMKVGQVSDPVQTRFGYHVIKVTERKAGGEIPFEDVKDQLTASLKNQEINDAIGVKIKELTDKAEIVVHFKPAQQSQPGLPPGNTPVQ